MALFLNSELKKCRHAHESYAIAQRRSDYTLARAKIRAKLFMASPEAILAWFTAGAFKGATTDDGKQKSKHALFSIAKTAAFNFIA